MSNYITVGFIVEGTTDVRFLGSIIGRTFAQVALECPGEIEVYEPQHIYEKGSYIRKIVNAAKTAYNDGIKVLCVHVDSDSKTDMLVRESKIIPSFEAVKNENYEEICRNLVSVVPIQESESWMLADLDVLKDEIGTTLSNTKLGLPSNSETRANPKEAIERAIRIARSDLTKRKRKAFSISELYQIIGQRVELEKLERLNSYTSFKDEVRASYKALGYLH